MAKQGKPKVRTKRKRPTQSQARAQLLRSKAKSPGHPVLLKQFIEQNRDRVHPPKAVADNANAVMQGSPEKRSSSRKRQKVKVVSSSRSLSPSSPQTSHKPETESNRSPSEPINAARGRPRERPGARECLRQRDYSEARSVGSVFSAHSLAESIHSLPPLPDTPPRDDRPQEVVVIDDHDPNRPRSPKSRGARGKKSSWLNGVVLFLNGVSKPFDDQSLKREVERVFPGMICRASCLSNGGVMLKEFQRREDVEKVKAFDWQTTIRGNLPFGGINNVRESKLPPKEVLQRTARLTVSQDSRGEWVRRRLMEEDWGECEVSEVGKPFGGVRTLRIVFTHCFLTS